MTTAPPPPFPDAAMQIMSGMRYSAAAQAAAKLRIADALGEEPMDPGDLAKTVGADPDAFARLMRALGAIGIFTATGDGRYAHNEASRSLRSDAPDAAYQMALLAGSEWSWVVWHRLAEAVRTGDNAFVLHYGKSSHEYFTQDDTEVGLLFHRAMTAISEATNVPVLAALDLTGVKSVADVGGGQGSLLRAVLEANPDITGTLFDTDQALSEIRPELRAGPLAGRVSVVAGDFHQEVPVSADLYLLKHVLHVWDDDTAVNILRNVTAGAPSGARVVSVEHLVADGPLLKLAAYLDLLMMLVTGGRERTEAEFAALFERAGLRMRGITKTASPERLIEATVP
ncbi:MAG: methyltransferase [Nonomuraea sp.]|nr:methyltransferase [Nonomuraea sp.]